MNHIALEYKRKGDPRNIHTNTIENFWSNFKRGLIGSFHRVSIKHLHRYLSEFDFRYNSRKEKDGDRTLMALKSTGGKRLMLRDSRLPN